MEKLFKEVEEFRRTHPDIAKAMEIFQMSMEDYRRACRFLHQQKTFSSDKTFPAETVTFLLMSRG